MSKAAEPIYQLTLRPLPNPADPTGIRRLRDALKRLLRQGQLRCIAVKEIAADDALEMGAGI